MSQSFRRVCSPLAAALLLAVPASAFAATFTVTRFDDPVPDGCVAGDCSLREAVLAANALVDSDTIVLGSGTYELTQSGSGADELQKDLDVTRPLTIQGNGSALTIVRMALPVPGSITDQRVLEAKFTRLSLIGLTLRDGHAQHPFFGTAGGCLRAVQMSLELIDVRLTGCVASAGGGLSMSGGSATMKIVAIEGNQAQWGGGLELRGSAVAGDSVYVRANTSTGGAGGIAVSGGIGHFASRIGWATGSAISDNVANANGGGIQIQSGAHLVIEPVADTTVTEGELLRIDNNRAQQGGGIYISGIASAQPIGTLQATRVGMSQNHANIDGGAIHAAGRLSLSESDVSSNDADNDGGGIAVRGDAKQGTIERVAFAYNDAGRYGGALSNAVAGTQLINVSSYANTALAGGGVDVVSNTDLMQYSSYKDTAIDGGSVRLAGIANSRNSVYAGGCQAAGGNFVEFGGSQQLAGATPCTGAAYSATQLLLKYGYYGGRFRIVGFATGSVLKDAGATMDSIDLRDARSYKRTLPIDVGAYEADAKP
jgi:CSLREA domain-containing protein